MSTFSCATGPPHDLQALEVRSTSLVLLWKPPVYQGRDQVNGYYVDIKEAAAGIEAWRGVNEKACLNRYLKVGSHTVPTMSEGQAEKTRYSW